MLESTAGSALDIPTDAEYANRSAVSWGAILAGGVASAAVTLILIALGAGVGFSSISPWSSSTAVTTFHVAAGLYFIVTAMLASSVGGYLAGRLRKKWAGAHTREVFFRDTAHGFLAWAFATLLSAGLLGSAAGILAGGAGAMVSAGQASEPLDPYVDQLMRPEPGSSESAAEASAERGMVARMFAHSFRQGTTVSEADRAYLVQLVHERSGLSQEKAEARVAATIEQARVAADRARKAAAEFALWLTASLFVGAFSASLAAIEGGGLRDGTWKYQV